MPYDVDHPRATESSAAERGLILAVGACLLAFVVAQAWLSRRTTSLSLDAEVAATWLVALSVPVGLIYVFGVRSITRRQLTRLGLGVVVIGGLAMRSILIASPPFLEDDFYRYLWDGAVTAQGIDPYRYAPIQVVWASVGAETVQEDLMPLAAEAGRVLERVNHPHLTTIYPPVAQVGFAVAHALVPWSTVSWRVVLLIADGVTLLILFRLLADLCLPLAAVVWYWWNPILLREIYGAAHMDALILPFLMASVLLATRKRFNWSMLLLSLAGGIKLWPLVLAPLLLRPLMASPRRLLFAGSILLVSTLAIWAPTFDTAFGPNSGFLAYASQWHNNAGAFSLLEALVRQPPFSANDGSVGSSAIVTRLIMVVALAVWIASLVRRPIKDGRDMLHRCLLVVAALFLLSPTQFPWYFVWLTPFLALTPNAAVLFYSALLPLYHLRAMHPGLLWVQHAPVWFLLIGGLALRLARRKDAQPLGSIPSLEATT